MTVSGLTMQRAECHSAQAPQSQAPQEPVEPVQFWLLDRALHHAKLMAESQDLKLQRRSSAETDIMDASNADNKAVDGN